MYYCRPSRWLWGLIPLALIGILVIYSLKGQIEKDLQSRAQSALSENGLSWAVPVFDGRDGVISGTLGRHDQRLKALAIVAPLRGVRIVEDRATLLASKKPYVWEASLKRERVRFKGYVSSETDRKTILGIARANFPGHELDDRMTLAGGAPPRETWLGGVSFALKYLSLLNRGSVRLEDDRIEFRGVAADIRGYQTIKEAFAGSLPAGIVLKSHNVRLPRARPFVWKAEYDGDSVVFTGHAPTEGSQKKLLSRARRVFKGARVVDRSTLASGARENWDHAAIEALNQLSRLKNGSAELSDKVLTLAGIVDNKQLAEEIESSLNANFPHPFTFKPKLSVAEQATAAIPMADPYRWSAIRANGVLTLKGFVPNARIRSAVLNFAKESVPNHRIVDEMKVGDGKPEEAAWLNRIRLGLRLVSRLNFGTVNLIDSELSIEGEASSVTHYQEVMTHLSEPATGGLVFKKVAIIPARVSPYTFTATFEKKTLSLMGYVPNQETRQAVMTVIEEGYRDVSVDNGLTLASGAPEQWRMAVLNGLSLLAKLKQGKLSLKDNAIVMEGTAASNTVAEQVKTKLREMGGIGFKKTSLIKVVENRSDGPITGVRKAAMAPGSQSAVPEKVAARVPVKVPARREQAPVPETGSAGTSKQDGASPVQATDGVRSGLEKDTKTAKDTARRTTVHDGGAAATTTKSDVAPKGGDATGMEPAESDNEANAAIPPAKQSSAADNITLATDAVVHGRPAAPKSGEENRDGNVMAGGGGFPFAADHKQSHEKPDGDDYSKINGDRKIAVKTWQAAIAKPKSPAAGPTASGRKNSRLAAKPILKSGECQEVFNSELISGTIMFEKRSAELRHGIEPLLHRLADVALRCPKTKIEIAGHTDSDGSYNFNRFLSLRRAETVVDFLVKAGVARNRLFAIGYGEDEPRVPNTSIRNKAKNRRIEFVVRG